MYLVCVQFRFSVFRLQCVQLSICSDFSVHILFVLDYSDSGVSDSGISDSGIQAWVQTTLCLDF